MGAGLSEFEYAETLHSMKDGCRNDACAARRGMRRILELVHPSSFDPESQSPTSTLILDQSLNANGAPKNMQSLTSTHAKPHLSGSRLLVQYGVCATVMATLQMHTHDAELFHLGCEVLVHLASLSDKCREELFKHGIAEYLLCLLQMHNRDINKLSLILKLMSIAALCKGSREQFMCSFPAIINIIYSHRENIRVLGKSCTLLANLSLSKSRHDPLRVVFPFIQDTITKHFDDETIILQSCTFCWRMLKGKDLLHPNRTAIDDTEILFKILPLAKEFSSNARVLQAIVTLISHATANNSTYQPSLSMIPCFPRAPRSPKFSGSLDSPSRSSTWRVLQSSPDSKGSPGILGAEVKSVNAEYCEIVVIALENHPYDEKVVLHGCDGKYEYIRVMNILATLN